MTLRLTLEDIPYAAALLKRGELVAFPTETVYGLGAPIFNEQAIGAIFQVKGRPNDNPLIAHISNLLQVNDLAIHIPPLFYRLADIFFPGPLTVVLQRHARVPSIVSAGLNTIALRMPSHKGALALIDAVGEPLVAPSANLSGKPSSTQFAHVKHDFDGKIAAIIDGGDTQYGIESTVLSLLGPVPILLRPGSIRKEEIEKVIGASILMDEAITAHTPLSPGMKYRHYTPKTPIRLFTEEVKIEEYVQHNPHKALMILKRGEKPPCQLSAQNLYAALRLADEQAFEEILIYCDEEILNHSALMNRISKASAT